MSVVIGSSIASLGVQRRLSDTNRSLVSTFERLSSGLRINRASDDAAGLSIASSLNVDQRVYSQGIRNVNDGLSLLAVADGALQELTNIVYRIQELAEQAANGTLGAQQRKMLDREAQSLRSEFQRIRNTSEFNNSRLLNGAIDQLKIQLGYGAGGKIEGRVGGAVGTGTFDPALLSGIGSSYLISDTADVNGDGYVDLIAGQGGSTTLAVYLANGDGTFKAGINSTGSLQAWSVETGDFNGDGILDIVNASYAWIEVRRGNGNGTFASSISYQAPGSINETAVGDINGDGYSDTMVFGLGTGAYAFLGSSTGLRDGSLVIDDPSAQFTDGHLADLDRDGALDLVVGEYNSSGFNVYRGNGNGTFKLQQHLGSVNSYSLDPLAYSGDVNNDGILDLLLRDGSGPTDVQIFTGNGNGTFKSPMTATFSGVYWKAADLNGDGHTDIAGADSGTVFVRLGNGNGTFRAESSFSTGGTAVSDLAIADFDTDGVLDLLTVNDGSNNASVLLAATSSGVTPLLNFDLKSIAGARAALPIMKQKLASLALHRGELGGLQSRLQTGIASLDAAVESYAGAESRIRDADIADEAAKSARLSILRQAGAALLAQANSESSLALVLLESGG